MFQSTKVIELGSCAFRQPKAQSHCRFIHGYRLLSKIWFNCKELDENNWVLDFGSLKALKEELEDIFDHSLLVSVDDPHLEVFKNLSSLGVAKLVIMHGGVGIEKFAEKVFYHADVFAKNQTNNRVWVTKVEVWEHEKNSAIYQNENAYTFVDPEEAGLPNLDKTLDKLGLIPEEIKLEAPAPVAPLQENPNAARVGNVKTTGWSNPFAGTSWGA